MKYIKTMKANGLAQSQMPEKGGANEGRTVYQSRLKQALTRDDGIILFVT